MATDLHPDVIKAINSLKSSKLGREYDRFARKTYGLSGARLAGKTVAEEFGGRSTKSGRGVVSSAGARGPAQFIPSTREAFIKQFGIDPWANDKQAIEGLMLHQLKYGGLKGYNPGMPSYAQEVLDQKVHMGPTGGRAAAPTQTQAAPRLAQDFSQERADARRRLLLGGEPTFQRLLAYKAQVSQLKDVPAKATTAKPTAKTAKSDAVPGKGNIYEVFYDPIGEYWDSGTTNKGAIGGHSDHVHVSGDHQYLIKLGRYAESLGLHVGENSAFDGSVPTSGHVEGSFHYKDMAIDVSGKPAAMRKFARVALKEAQSGRGR